ncbi:myosin heavy chain 95F isoform X2 [Culicoides brevitarsis]|uniref:myosin heavy chain 95F isoform X2 n=1 Tax=Culicoides brevitarsis TaxID=469753 RepID=UPI00307B4B17
MMVDSQLVWARDPHEGYVKGKITELGAQEFEVQPLDRKAPKRQCLLDEIYPACENDKTDHDDSCEMMFLNEATLLDNIKNRYYKDKIYTFVANILIAVNPYKEIKDLYSSTTITKYQNKSLGELPPHVYAIADKAVRDMRVFKMSQSIIVSGESGTGKTESTKYILRYLCESAKTAGPIETKILDANPILEAFGNSKTTRNNNSSRFGKFIEVHYDPKWQVVGGHISHYLLEKSRIITQNPEERNYHVFYMLCAGAPPQLREKLYLSNPDDFRILSGCNQYFSNSQTDKLIPNSQKSKSHLSQGSLRDPLLDDYKDFLELDQALSRLGITDEHKNSIYALVAAVLHLGNIRFEENPDDTRGGCRVATNGEQALTISAKLIGLDTFELRTALTSRIMQSKGGGIKGTVIMVPLKVHEANNARDALAKALYGRLFDHIVALINQNIPFQASAFYIGVLDIAGFEYFTVNSFEQFCINYCNEKLQKFFNDNILMHEQELYKREGLNVPEIKFTDNQDIIDLIESKTTGVFTLLDEESKLPKPSYDHFTSEVHKQWQGHFRISLPRASRLKSHRTLRDEEGFLIRHFAGAVCYNTNQFIEKNNDALHSSLEALVQECSNPLLKKLFEAKNSSSTKGKLSFISVGSKFKTQLGDLMKKLEQNGTNFIRCIKPNSKMTDHDFEGGLALAQLKCSGTTSVLELMEYGYPSRVPFTELYNMYKGYLPPELAKLQPRTFCEAMLHSLKLNSKDFKFGITRVFFRPGKFVEFDRIMKSDPENLRAIVANVKKWLVRSRWIKSAYCAISVIKIKNRIKYRNKCVLMLQKTIRGYLVRKQHQPRYRGIVNIRQTKANVSKMEELANQLKGDKAELLKCVNEIQQLIDGSIQKIKSNPKITQNQIKSIQDDIAKKMDSEMSMLKQKLAQQKNAEEQERLRKIQQAMEAEKRAKEEEQRKLQQEEEDRKRKAEMEMRRKQEEQERIRLEEEDMKAAMELQKQLEKEAQDDQRYRKQLEQERRDHELAMRLAEETNGQIDESPTFMRKSEQIRAQQQLVGKQKFDLSKWKYSELRDAINTSCDIELLEACRHEFHRRLKVYHAWKAKNRKRTTMDENERAPRSIMEAAAKAPPRAIASKPEAPTTTSIDRYFRIPFVRPSNDPNDNTKRGWWYAHFDGQYVARQMELHAEKPPILLVAGVDDMQMCELSLEETGLTRKRGAEILEHEFNSMWERNGGKPYRKMNGN